MIDTEPLNELGKIIQEINTANGWNVTIPEDWEGPYKVPAILALIHSEVGVVLLVGTRRVTLYKGSPGFDPSDFEESCETCEHLDWQGGHCTVPLPCWAILDSYCRWSAYNRPNHGIDCRAYRQKSENAECQTTSTNSTRKSE